MKFTRRIRFIIAAAMAAALSAGGAHVRAEDVKAKDALSVIHSRKSVRQYTGVPVSKDELMTLVKAGMAAPSAMDKRPWAFVVVTDGAMLKKLASGMPYSKMIVPAGSAIVVCGDLSKTASGKMGEFWVQDCSAVTENILLAAEATGLGACWTAAYPSDERFKFVQDTLGMPKDIVPLCVVAVGHPTGAEKPKDKFDNSVIHWEKW